MARKRKTLQSTSHAVDLLNDLNRPGVQKRRHTTHDTTVNTTPDPPAKRSLRPRPSDLKPLSASSPHTVNNQLTRQQNESDGESDAQSSGDEPHEESEDSEEPDEGEQEESGQSGVSEEEPLATHNDDNDDNGQGESHEEVDNDRAKNSEDSSPLNLFSDGASQSLPHGSPDSQRQHAPAIGQVEVVISNSTRDYQKDSGNTQNPVDNDTRHSQLSSPTPSRNQWPSANHSLEPHVPEAPQTQLSPTNPEGPDNSIHAWFLEAISGSQQESNWKELPEKSKTLRRRVRKRMKRHFQGCTIIIKEWRRLYKNLADLLPSESRRIGSMLPDFVSLGEAIYTESRRIFEYAAEVADDENGSDLINQYEAYVITKIITVVMVAFKAFKLLGQPGKRHLRVALDMLLKCCDRVLDLQKSKCLIRYQGCPNTLATSRSLRLPLRRIMAALDAGELDDPREQDVKAESLIERLPSTLPTQPRWTQSEEHALIAGLREFRGSNRWVKIKRYYGLRLTRWTLSDLQHKAEEFR
ncbi:hypothetical protein NUU61_002714 [Penicillium alfredii]|uniref:Uncharacterized protein n=1 Tax=Penicillium alfredii TaxID=1506179 RepID=A0A9W9FT27_9EURO|nr:uncharacterized protein NUU61_002714 [Penicillium alfredii]KAJ5105367.1 hypothetical protein NUU61_002714 [Penicillium alfredii]